MSISIYKTLLESYSAESLKEYFKTELFKYQDLVDEYINYRR